MTEQAANTFSFSMYAANGARVYFVFDAHQFADDPFTSALTAVAQAEARGFTVREVGVKPGEKIATVSHVSRRQFIGKDKELKNVLDMWRGDDSYALGQFRSFGIYMDSDADYAGLKAATGIDYNSLPLFKNAQPAVRNDPNTGEYVMPLSTPVRVVFKGEVNDKGFDVNCDFVRWADVNTSAPASTDTSAPSAKVTNFPNPTNPLAKSANAPQTASSSPQAASGASANRATGMDMDEDDHGMDTAEIFKLVQQNKALNERIATAEKLDSVLSTLYTRGDLLFGASNQEAYTALVEMSKKPKKNAA